MKRGIVVITGGPGTGKTTIINSLVEKGYVCYPEISREVTLEAKRQGIDQLFLTEPLLFSQMLLDGRIKQFENAQNEGNHLVFIDRGIPDVLAYMDFIGDECPEHFDLQCHETRYDTVFVLPPWEEIYISDEARYENFDQAKIIYEHLKLTYQKYGYKLIEVPIGTVEHRVDFIFEQLKVIG
ncbi:MULTISPECIES: AAA family ATPase [Flavobacterium]|uniref:ATP-binding protein n=1 Tax=Flavobacterium covae TaxID=2906076 RepID=A0ABW8PHH2_9FLAO|nr:MULTISPECIES: ATP-binding protein [Flavobacterium]OXA78494.1 ATPase [Flavobacterium columnare] [Flavobacterium columnare NBRC 100251 = ATCC 23463]AMA49572.1 ATPase [Flavobacterium covae]AND63270.1 ATPase [Flavobacterium covae]MCH4828857.1 ATP-binding protein [Flavobacterium columnare]MCH4832111.1 ATP-binding protein [Flavobacterium columnare]